MTSLLPLGDRRQGLRPLRRDARSILMSGDVACRKLARRWDGTLSASYPERIFKERQSKLVLSRSSKSEDRSMCQKAFCGSGNSCMPSTTSTLIRSVANTDRWAVGSFCSGRWDELGDERRPSINDLRNNTPSAPCSNSNILSSTPSCRQTDSTQIVGQEVHCLKKPTYTQH